MIHTHTYKNGLRVVLEPVSTVRSVAVGIWVLTGSRNEHTANNGISHFLEHMFFKGTKKRTASQIAEAFDAIGGRVNAFTSKEYTCFYAHVLDTHVHTALELLTDIFFDSVFPEEEIAREKKVVMEEIKMYGDTPDDHVHDMLAEAAFDNHSLGRPILGTEETLKGFTKDSLEEHIHNHYTANNVVVSVAGHVTEDLIHEMEGYFDRFTQPNQVQPIEKPIFTANTLEEQKDTKQVHVCLGYEGLAFDHEQIPALLLMNKIFGGGMSSRLFQEIREKRGLAYNVFSYHIAYKDSGFLGVYAGTTQEQLAMLKKTMDATIDQLLDFGITREELQNSKTQLESNMMIRLESTSSRMSRNGRNELLLQKHQTMDEAAKNIELVTVEEINQLMKTIFETENAKAMIRPL